MAIAEVIQHYRPKWIPPPNQGHRWERCLCPFHDEDNPSAAVSYEYDAFNCMGCGLKGDAIKIIRYMEGCSYREAKQTAARLSPGSYNDVPRESGRQSGRRVFGQPGTASGVSDTGNQSVPVGIRSRTPGWA